jgi:hypothetical protein
MTMAKPKVVKMYDVSNPATLADEIGRVRAKLKILSDSVKGLESLAKASGHSVLEGKLFRVTIVTADRKTTDWKSIAMRSDPSHQLISANTKTSETVSVRVSAHVK